jgi:uncharacterized protein
MSRETDENLTRLRTLIRSYGSVLVAYSGGVDSALVLAVATRELGDRSLACIGVSASYPARERREAVEFAESIGARYGLIETGEQSNPRYAANAGDRCYFCRAGLFRKLHDIASTGNWHAIADGVHLDDTSTHVNGIRAAREAGVRSPLFELGLRKSDVRDLARAMDLAVWDKPAVACLASRVPRGVPITPALLAQIDAAEEVIAALGFRQFRVRYHGDVARLELPCEEFERAVQMREPITAGLRACGFRFVTLDLSGFRSASVGVGEPSAACVPLHVLRRGV